jgi:uncharacterized protein (DUF1501 family)
MFRIDAGSTSRYCDGLSRRSFLKVGVAGMASAALGDVLAAKAASAPAAGSKDTACILIWLDGGPGHMDTYDMKPDAPAEYRGLWKTIPTNVPGFHVTELFPRQARVADKFSIVRSLHHDTGDHFTAGHVMLTGRAGRVSGANLEGEYPCIGSIVAKTRGPIAPGLPAYVAVPHAASIGLRPGYFGANYLGVPYNPFETNGDPNAAQFQVSNLGLTGGLTVEKLEDRRSLAGHFDRVRRDVDRTGTFDAMDRFNREAFDLVTGPAARKAFDISTEDPRLRDRYGRHSWGQSTLLARRLVEAGVTFTTVHLGGWDHHWDLKAGYENYLPKVEALFSDLDDRGLLEKTLVVLCGEFSRTPKMNDGSGKGTPGRDHWGNSMFCLVGGGGVKGGRLVGSTDRLGTAPKDLPLTVPDLHATIYHVLGVDPHTSFLDRTGRPVPASDRTEPIAELF